MIKIANNLINLVLKMEAAKSAGSGLKQRAADALRKYGPYSREYRGLIMKLTNEQLKQDHTNDDGVVDWAAYYSGGDGDTKETKESSAWQRAEGKNPAGGLNRKGVAAYRAENPGSKLQMAVTTEPSKLDPDSKPAKRRKSFCARMGGMPGAMEDEKGRPTRKALALRKWNC